MLRATRSPKNNGSTSKLFRSGKKIGMKMMMISVHSNGQPSTKSDDLSEYHEAGRRKVERVTGNF